VGRLGGGTKGISGEKTGKGATPTVMNGEMKVGRPVDGAAGVKVGKAGAVGGTKGMRVARGEGATGGIMAGKASGVEGATVVGIRTGEVAAEVTQGDVKAVGIKNRDAAAAGAVQVGVDGAQARVVGMTAAGIVVGMTHVGIVVGMTNAAAVGPGGKVAVPRVGGIIKGGITNCA
jgi:hypothetical protein